MAKKRMRKPKKVSIIIIILVCLCVCSYIVYCNVSIISEANDLRIENNDLKNELNELKGEEVSLKVQVDKLQDPDYVAKYAREKYLYSGKDEYIIRIK
jgi:cell division protein DivIC